MNTEHKKKKKEQRTLNLSRDLHKQQAMQGNFIEDNISCNLTKIGYVDSESERAAATTSMVTQTMNIQLEQETHSSLGEQSESNNSEGQALHSLSDEMETIPPDDDSKREPTRGVK